jgi:hypothetical protein
MFYTYRQAEIFIFIWSQLLHWWDIVTTSHHCKMYKAIIQSKDLYEFTTGVVVFTNITYWRRVMNDKLTDIMSRNREAEGNSAAAAHLCVERYLQWQNPNCRTFILYNITCEKQSYIAQYDKHGRPWSHRSAETDDVQHAIGLILIPVTDNWPILMFPSERWWWCCTMSCSIHSMYNVFKLQPPDYKCRKASFSPKCCWRM